MRQTFISMTMMLALALLATGCTTSSGYPKEPTPCDDFATSYYAWDEPCGPKRPINW